MAPIGGKGCLHPNNFGNTPQNFPKFSQFFRMLKYGNHFTFQVQKFLNTPGLDLSLESDV